MWQKYKKHRLWDFKLAKINGICTVSKSLVLDLPEPPKSLFYMLLKPFYICSDGFTLSLHFLKEEEMLTSIKTMRKYKTIKQNIKGLSNV